MRGERIEKAYATRSVHGSDPSRLFEGGYVKWRKSRRENEDADTGQRGDSI